MSERAPRIVVVDDDDAMTTVLAALLEQADYEVEAFRSALAALERLESGGIDLVLTDLRMPTMDGMALLAECTRRFEDVPVVMLTAHGTVPLAVEAMRAGAKDFVLKPFEKDDLIAVVARSIRSAAFARAEPPRLAMALDPMAEVEATIDKVAATDITVLIRGESGTGKERVADRIHAASRRRDGPLVKVNCAAIPADLLESELYGHRAGAFTGANVDKPGRAVLADGGTLFLDEIGDVAPSLQAKLLRLLQERTVEPVGGVSSVSIDVRFVAATNRPLEAMVASGEFREDLFYRLNVVPIALPALRERRGDIPQLARRVFEALKATNERPALTLEDEAVAALVAHDWPGNIRELQNILERSVVLADGPRIRAVDIETHLGRPAPIDDTLEAQRAGAEREAVLEALRRSGGNRTQAARLLGVSRRTLYNKLAAFDLA